MSQITVKDKVYRCGKLDAFAQLHVVRRIGPVLIVAGISLEVLKSGAELYFQDMMGMATPIMDFVANMKEADADYVMISCLDVIERREGDAWAPVNVRGQKKLMYEDIDLPTMLRIIVQVLRDNLGNFLTELRDGLPSTSSSSPGSPQ